MTNDDITLCDSNLDDEDDLRAGLAGMAGIVANDCSLQEMLTQVAAFTMLAVPRADGAGVTMLETGEPDMNVATTQYVHEVDGTHHQLGRRPGSALSMPLIVDGQLLGALDVYAYASGAFGGSSRALCERFAQAAAVAIHNARLLDQAHRHNARLRLALSNRSKVDQAVGIVMSRAGIDVDEAFVRLRVMSEHQHIKLSLVAEQLVDDAVQRADAHQSDQEHQSEKEESDQKY